MKNIPLVLAQAVADEIGSEKVLWADAPEISGYIRRHWKTAAFGIPFTAFSVFWTCAATSFPGRNGKPAPTFFLLWGLMFIGIGLWQLLAPLQAAGRAGRTYYVVTEQRAVIFEKGWKLSLRSFDSSVFDGFERVSGGDSAGDLIFQRKIERRGRGTSVSEVGFFGLRDFAAAETALRAMLARNRSG